MALLVLDAKSNDKAQACGWGLMGSLDNGWSCSMLCIFVLLLLSETV